MRSANKSTYFPSLVSKWKSCTDQTTRHSTNTAACAKEKSHEQLASGFIRNMRINRLKPAKLESLDEIQVNTKWLDRREQFYVEMRKKDLVDHFIDTSETTDLPVADEVARFVQEEGDRRSLLRKMNETRTMSNTKIRRMLLTSRGRAGLGQVCLLMVVYCLSLVEEAGPSLVHVSSGLHNLHRFRCP